MDILSHTGASAVIENKTCSRCKEKYPVTYFTHDKQRRDGLRPQCKSCSRKKSRAWIANNSNPITPAKQEINKRYRLKQYGLTIDDHDSLLSLQQDRCAICDKDASTLCVDHDHETDKVRGLLCHNCNRGLGLLGDNIESLRRALRYLEASV